MRDDARTHQLPTRGSERVGRSARQRGSMCGSWGGSPLVCQESSGANYCRQRRLLLTCVSENSSGIPGLYSLMGGLLMRCRSCSSSITSLRGSHPSRSHFHPEQLRVFRSHGNQTPSRSVFDNGAAAAAALTPLHYISTCPSPTTQYSLFFWLSSSRSRRSTLCSPAPWWTCSPSSIRALKSSASWSVPTLRSSETT